MSKQYLKLQNQGTILQNLQLLSAMVNSEGYEDGNGYFSKHAVAEIAINDNIITSGGKIGEDVIQLVNDETIEEGNNSVLQNAKQRMQILRVLGLVATDYDSELYSITNFGMNVLKSVFPLDSNEIPNYALLLQAFMGITSTSEVYEFNCDPSFNCFLGYEICYALALLDYKIGVHEMPLITACSIEKIDSFVNVVKKYRKKKIPIPETNEFVPKTQKGLPVKDDTNLTRTINQILKLCEIFDSQNQVIDGREYYICSKKGKNFVNAVKRKWKKYRFWTPTEFRKLKFFDQKSICCLGYNNILSAGGFEVSQVSPKDVFSPYQLIPENNANWFLGKKLRKPPTQKQNKEYIVNNQVPSRILSLRPNYFSSNDYEQYVQKFITKDNLIRQVVLARKKGESREAVEEKLLSSCKKYTKVQFYPFVHSLLKIIGLECSGEVARIDGYCKYNGHEIPVEIKSYTETATYNLKGFRQALENKIVLYKNADDLEYASLVVGFSSPTNTTELKEFMDACFQETGIKIIAIDMRTLIEMSMNVIWEKKCINLDELLHSYGFMGV